MRKFIDTYYRLLCALLVAAVAVLIIPVSLQIFSRFTSLIPSYIWTEEMARFFFIWMIMIGAMVGVRDGGHFDVDLWPVLKPRANALLRIVTNLCVLVFALVFAWYGIKFVQFGWDQSSELAELPMLYIFAAWPMAGLTWLVFLGEHFVNDLRIVASARAAMSGGTISPDIAALILFGVFFALMAIRVPVAFALGLACLPVMFIEPRLSPMILFNETFKSYNSFILLAVPFFLLTANLMNVGGITDRLVRLSRDLVGHLPGGLAQVNVVLSIFFAGISGSSTADAASQGKIFIEAQVKEGYDLSFSVAITAVSAVLAVIIPPSILMIVWGGTLQVSIGALFLAGILPGLLLGAVQMATVHVYAKLRNYPKYPRSNLKEIFVRAGDLGARLMTPVIIIGGKIFGWFTATESAAIAVLYAGALSIFVYREMNGRQLHARAARYRQAGRGGAVLRRHRQRLRLAAGLLPDPEGAAGGRGLVGHGHHRHRLFHRLLLPRRRLLPGRHPGDHHRRHDPRAAGTCGAHGPGALRDDRHHLAGLRPGDAAVRPVPDDLLRHRQGAADVRDEGRDDHADADAGRAGADHLVPRDHPVPAEADLAGVPEVAEKRPAHLSVRAHAHTPCQNFRRCNAVVMFRLTCK